MKTSLKVLVGAAVLATSMASFAAYVPGAGITGTPHDWSGSAASLLQWVDPISGLPTTYNSGVVYIDPVTGKQGVVKVSIGQCTRCHTPHQAKTANLLWNHTLQAITYQWNVPQTTAGTPYAKFQGDTYKGPTTKCLSCHDGLLASTDGMWFNRASTSGAKHLDTPGALDTGHAVSVGTDMSKTHPVAMPYPVNGSANTYNFSKNGVNIAPTEWVADPMATNQIRMYNDDGAGNIVAGTNPGKTGIECSSCHDVHNGARTKDQLLLTGLMTGSNRAPGGYICTQCHLK